MIYLSAQPDHKYFHWQLEIQFLNFQDLEIPLSSYHVVIGIKEEPSEGILLLQKRYPEVIFSFIKDTRVKRKYIPSIRPHILSKYFTLNTNLEQEQIFYFDADVIFRERLDFTVFKDEFDYVSDTDSYLGWKYIDGKGKTLLQDMCSIVGVEVEKVRNIPLHGGAQYFFQKGLSSKFWEEIERTSVELYCYLQDNIHLYAQRWAKETNSDVEKYHEIQSWCSDMWCVFWELLKYNRGVVVSEELNFSWGTSSLKSLQKTKIFHNAGVTEANEKELFYKGRYINGLPESFDISYIKEDRASIFYAKYVDRVVRINKEKL